MATEPKSRRRRRKKILRKDDGSLYDVSERRRITTAELRDYVRDGGLFEARRQEGGADCTHEVLQSVMGVGLLENLVPGMGGGSLPGLGGLGALAGGGPLGALGGGGALGELARLVADNLARGGPDWGWGGRRGGGGGAGGRSPPPEDRAGGKFPPVPAGSPSVTVTCGRECEARPVCGPHGGGAADRRGRPGGGPARDDRRR